MASLSGLQYAGEFSGPREPADTVVVQNRIFTWTATAAVGDTVSLFILPAGWQVAYLSFQVEAAVASTATIDVGTYAVNSVTGAIGTVDDIDCYMDGIAGAAVGHHSIVGAGQAAIATDLVVAATLLTMTTPAAGIITGFATIINAYPSLI